MRSILHKCKRSITMLLIVLLTFSTIATPVSATAEISTIDDVNERNDGDDLQTTEEGEGSSTDQINDPDESLDENSPTDDSETPENRNQTGDSDNSKEIISSIETENSEASQEIVTETKVEKEKHSYDISEVKQTVEDAVDKTITYYKNNLPQYSSSRKGGYGDYWKYSALWGAGVKDLKNDLPWESEEASPWGEHSFWMNGLDKANTASNADAGTIIGSILLNQNPYSFGYQNVVEDLANKQKEDGSFAGAWGDPWAIIALYLVDGEYEEDKLLSAMINRQTSTGMFGDADATGWTLMAIAPYKDSHQEVSEAVEKSVEYIHRYYQENNELPGQNWGVNSNAIASMIMGLAAVGEDLFSEKWTTHTEEGYVNLLENFVTSYQLEDGSFKWQQQQTNTNGAATEQSLLALASALAGESIFVQLKREKTIPEGPDVAKTNVIVRVEGINDTILSETEIKVETINERPTVLDATLQAFTEVDLPFREQYGYISSIAGEEEATFEGYDGWIYIVNGKLSNFYANQHEIKEGDEIVWYYGNPRVLETYAEFVNDVEKLTLLPKIIVPSEISENEEIEVRVTSEYGTYDENWNVTDHETNIKDATIHFDGKTYSTNVNGIAVIPAEDVKAGEYDLRVTKDIENSYPRLLRQSKRIIVNESEEPQEKTNTITQAIIISEQDGEIPLPFTETEVFEGDNAIDVLKRIAKEENIPVETQDLGWGEYVTSIAGVAEYGRGEQSGWFVRINGKFANVGASDVYLIPGDKVEWLYSLNWGEDIGATEFVTIRETKPEVIIENKPEKRLVREPVQELKIEAQNYFGTKVEPTVILNGEPVEKTLVTRTNDVQMISFFSLPSLMAVAEEEEYVYRLEFVEGRNEIQIIAVDSEGREEIEVIDFVYVPEGQELKQDDPNIIVEDEIDNTTVVSPSFTFSMIVEDYLFNLLTPTIEINGETVDYEHKNFEYTVQLSKGENDLRITVEDEDGRTAEESFVIIYENEEQKDDEKDKEKEEKAAYSEQVSKAIVDVSKIILGYGVTTEWQAIGLNRAGYSNQPQMEQFESIFEANLQRDVIEQDDALITDIERLALAALALEKDPTDINGVNLIEKVYNSADRSNGADSLLFQGNNGIAYALIVLDADNFDVPEGAKWTRQKLINELLTNQRSDGAWNLQTSPSDEFEANYDITAMALTALAPYSEDPEVKEAVNKAVTFLSENQLDTGGYMASNENEPSIETTAQIIIGLTSNGIDPRDSSFTKENGNILDYLFSFQADDGGFKHLLSNTESEPMATEQALLALVAFDIFIENGSRLFDFTIERENREPIDPVNPVEEPNKELEKDKKQQEKPEGEGSGKEEKEEDTSVQEKAQNDSNQSKGEDSITADEESKQLPSTATNTYNLLLLGTLIMIIGFSIYFIRKKIGHNKG